MTTYAVSYYDDTLDGELIELTDHVPACSRDCVAALILNAETRERWLDLGNGATEAGEMRYLVAGADGLSTYAPGGISFGRWPGGWETDTCEYCGHCERLMWHGLQCPAWTSGDDDDCTGGTDQ